MIVKDILESLKYGELKIHALGGYEEPFTDEMWLELRTHLNAGLRDLYTRFPLKESELLLETEYDVSTYPLPEDVLQVIDVVSENYGSFEINSSKSDKSVYLPTYKTIQIPEKYLGEKFSIVYRACPTVLEGYDENTVIDIPVYMEEPLLAYVEYKVNKAYGTEVGIQLGTAAKQTYEMLCSQISERNMLNEFSSNDNYRFELNGWI